MKLARWVRTPTDERLARQWAAIAARQKPRRGGARWALVAVACAALVALGLHARPRARAPVPVAAASAPEKLSLEASSGASVLSLDGVRVELVGDAHVDVERESARVTVALADGTVRFDVKHDPARTLVVRAGDVEVEDVGTRFSVERRGGAVIVAVAEGAVRVRRGGAATAEVHSGETWSVGAVTATPAPPLAPAAPDPFVEFKALALAHRENEAYARLGEDGFARAVARASASDLFLLGDVARLASHADDAARAYDALRKRYRGDEHAGLAAFELGRLRLDRLHDPKGAAEAFADALSLAPAAPFREDAQARRVEALDRAGEFDACRRARAEYLATFPGGLYESRVEARCVPP